MKISTIHEILPTLKLPEGIDNPDCVDIKQQTNWFNVKTEDLLSSFGISVPCSVVERIKTNVDKHVRFVQIIKGQYRGIWISYSAIVFKGRTIGVLQTELFTSDDINETYQFIDKQSAEDLQNYLIDLISNAYKTINTNIFIISKGETFTKCVFNDIYYIKPEVLELLKGN